MKLLVVGASGQVASALAALMIPGVRTVALGRPDLDLARPDTLLSVIEAHAPDVVANVGAYTAVDQAESEPDAAHRVNALGPEAVARACAGRNLPMIHISTDYVFAGDKASPYTETDAVDPQGVYGRTKLEGEQRVAGAWRRHAILRTAWVYSHEGKNFVRTMLRLAKTRPVLGVVDDQQGCPTYAPDLARAIVSVAQKLVVDDDARLYGVFHAAGSGACSWREFAEAIFAASKGRSGPAATVNPILTSAYPTPARRPANSRLDCSRLKAIYDVHLPHWSISLDACMDRIAAGGFDVG